MSAAPPVEPVTGPPSNGDETIQILLVDDLIANLDALEVMLESTGCRMVRAQSADAALLALLEQDFAAVVLDIKMPGIDGIELARMIKQRKRTQHIPILLVTAAALDEGEMVSGYAAGAVSYLSKPINPIVLRSKLAAFADLARGRRALAKMNESLQREVAERQKAEEALREANRDLEQRVLERTEALLEADRRKDEFLAMLAHELRNPLAPARYATRILDERGGTAPELVWARGVIERQINQMARLVDDLLDVSRISRGSLVLQRERVSLAAVLRESLDSSMPLMEQNAIEVSVTLPPDSLQLDGDPLRLSQAFVNLLGNATKYSPPGGRVTLSAVRTGDQVEIVVKDAGIGIPSAMLERIFEMFTQVDQSLERSRGGLGVGLALVKRVIELHGGTVTALSDGPGRGSEFRVMLPVGGAATGPVDAKPSSRTARRHKVLIAEDGKDAADSMAMLLTIMGHDVKVAYDGEEAVTMAGEFRPAAIIMDVGMPKLNGYDAARRIRGEVWGRHVHLIALTGWGQADDRRRSKDAGFDQHFTKPVDLAELEKVLSAVKPAAG